MNDREPLPHRVRRAFRLDIGRRKSIDDETDAELRFHLEQRVSALVAAGKSRDQAEKEALDRFGPYEESREEILEAARGREEMFTMIDRLDGARQDALYVARQLRRSPGFTVAVMLTFALGIGANATMFGIIDQVLLRPPAFVRDPAHVVTLAYGRPPHGFTQKTANYPVFKAIRDRAQGFEQVAATDNVDVPLGRGESAQNLSGLLVSASYFPMLGVSPRIGRFFRPEEDVEPMGAAVVVLSYGFWTRHFDRNARAIGSVLDLGDRQFTVIGVTPEGFTGLELAAPDVWIPITAAGALQPMGRTWASMSGGTWLRVFARVRPDIPPERAAEDALRVSREAAPDAFFTGKGWEFGVIPIMSARASEQGAGASVMTLLGAMSIVVLLIACANVANLLLARGLKRRREIAVRLALGVARGRLLRLLITESVLLALLGGAAAILVAYWGGSLVRRLLLGDLTLDVSPIDGRVLAFTALIAVIVGLMTGLFPALQSSKPNLSGELKAGNREGGGQRSRTRNVLLVAQAALSLVFLAGAGLFVRSLAQLADMPLGIDIDRVLFASMNLRSIGRPQTDVDAIFARALERVKNVPGVQYAAVAATVPFGRAFGTDFSISGADSIVHSSAMMNTVTPEYFAVLGTRVVGGRVFTDRDGAGAPRVVVINEMLANRVWGRGSPIGRCMRFGADTSPCAEVVGVVQNVRRQSLFEDSTGSVYFPLAQVPQLGYRQMLVRPAGNNPTRVIQAVRTAIQTAAPQLPYANVYLASEDQVVRRELRPTRLGASMFGAFGMLALVLAAVGIYAVVSYDVGQRTREMGVRLALGARGADVGRLVVRDGVRVIALGAAIGIVVVLLGAKFVAPLLYQTSARDPFVIAGVSATLLLVAIAACIVPAWRAMRVDAAVALRSE
jgi:putative ABC transport system permease protein